MLLLSLSVLNDGLRACFTCFTQVVFFTAWCVLCLQARNAQQTTALQEKDAEINRLRREPRVGDRITILQWSILIGWQYDGVLVCHRLLAATTI